MQTAKSEFVFYTSLGLIEATGHKARNIDELLGVIKIVDSSSIFYHTHRYFREHHFIRGEYSSDFAQWAMDSLHESELGEKLAAIDIHRFSDIETLRNTIIESIEEGISNGTRVIDAPKGMEFYFCKSISLIMPTNYRAKTLDEFVQALNKVSINSLYFHLFEARLRLGKNTNDFSNWIDDGLGNPDLARKIEKLDPYLHTLEELRDEIIKLINKYGNSKT